MNSSTGMKIAAAVMAVVAVALGVLVANSYRQSTAEAEAARAAAEAQQAQVPQTLAVVAVKPLEAYQAIPRDAVSLVPVSRVPEFLTKARTLVEADMPGVRPVAFGHLGDGNIHFNLSQPEDMEAEAFLAEWQRVNRMVHDLVAGAFEGIFAITLNQRQEALGANLGGCDLRFHVTNHQI